METWLGCGLWPPGAEIPRAHLPGCEARAQEESSLPHKLHEGLTQVPQTRQNTKGSAVLHARPFNATQGSYRQDAWSVTNETLRAPRPITWWIPPPCRALALSSSKKTNQPSQVQNLRHNVTGLIVLKRSGSWRNQSEVRRRLEAPRPAQGWGWTAACRLG